MELKDRLVGFNKSLAAFILFTVFWSVVVIFSGTLTSGFHFVDDHEIITIEKNINDNGFLSATRDIIKTDLTFRFRPFYYLHRIFLVVLFGTNTLYWSINYALLAVLSSFLLFLFIYRQGYTFVNAMLFPLLTLVGPQSVIWWRLGPGESIGIFLFSASLFLLVNAVIHVSRFQLFISVICLLLATLSKESFTLLIPAYLLILIWINWQNQLSRSIFSIIRSNIVLIVILSLILIIIGYILIFVVGTGYSGIDSSLNFRRYLASIYSHFRYSIFTKLIICGLFFLLQNVKSREIVNGKANTKTMIRLYFFPSLVLLAIILPQFLLYFNSGLWGRYLLPLNLGLSLFVIFLSERISRSDEITLFTKRAFVVFIILAVAWFFKSEIIPNSRAFAKDGKATNQFLTSICENTNPDDLILVVLDGSSNYEHGFSINYFLSIKADRKNIRFYTFEDPSNTESEKILRKRFNNYFDTLVVKNFDKNFACIAVFPFDNIEMKNKLDNNSAYQRKDFEEYTVYLRNK